MAAFDTNRTFTIPSANRVSRAVANVFGALSARNDARKTRLELSQLTTRELDDIGLCRGDIERIATRRV